MADEEASAWLQIAARVTSRAHQLAEEAGDAAKARDVQQAVLRTSEQEAAAASADQHRVEAELHAAEQRFRDLLRQRDSMDAELRAAAAAQAEHERSAVSQRERIFRAPSDPTRRPKL
jgi:hypothetical protein